ncbi:hypothetical protein DSO57_1016420 [Entomophthora muscae]|uniref:Uncharacterized protein n=1 Tax=Entomophthora muscae TaxID=34485 RepID=A0ACC2TSJ2_9FUNG|nr:hypothetical protein DSO57_1016420 [Entomophthora muscae]
MAYPTQYVASLNTFTSDKFLLSICMEKSQLRDLNPETLWATSLQAQPPVFFWAQIRNGFDFGETSKRHQFNPSTSRLCPIKDPLSPVNESTNPGNIPVITWTTENGELQKLPQ